MAGYAGTRPTGRFEVFSWLFMRVSGVVLLVMVLVHLVIMHYGITVKELSFDIVAERWDAPFWRLYDFILLGLALVHGVNGARIVIDDYVRSPGWRLLVKTMLAAVFAVLMIMGAWVVVTFDAARFAG